MSCSTAIDSAALFCLPGSLRTDSLSGCGRSAAFCGSVWGEVRAEGPRIWYSASGTPGPPKGRHSNTNQKPVQGLSRATAPLPLLLSPPASAFTSLSLLYCVRSLHLLCLCGVPEKARLPPLFSLPHLHFSGHLFANTEVNVL